MIYWEIAQPRYTLTQYAEEMGIPIPHFFGGTSSKIFQILSGCSSVWYRHTWQNDDQVSQEEVASEILFAERQISELIGYPIAPTWVTIDAPVPKHELKDRRGDWKRVAANIGYVHSGGIRVEELLAEGVSVAYTDEDGDGFSETGTIDVSSYSAEFAGWNDDYGELKVVASGYGTAYAADMYQEYENGEITVFAWHMIKPDVASRFPGSDLRPVNLDDTSNLIQTVDIYRVYNDKTQACKIVFSDDSTVDCTIRVEDVSAGIVRPIPVDTTFTCGSDKIPLRYQIGLYAGYIDQPGWTLPAAGKSTYSPLFASMVRMLATSRLARDICGCNNVATLAKALQTDMALVSPQGNFLAVADAIQECPLGTKQGEWLTWNAIRTFSDKHYTAATVL